MSDMGKTKELELTPVSDKAVYNVLTTKEESGSYFQDVIIEEDLLVPDTEPDMEQILNVSAVASSVSYIEENGKSNVKGELKVEVLYRSIGDGSLLVLDSMLPYRKDWNKTCAPGAEVRMQCDIMAADYRILNERKYRIRISVRITAREIIAIERNIFEGIKDRNLEVLKEEKNIINLASTIVRENEVDDELKINNEKIRPVRIIKSSFDVCENHRQLTSEKLVVNTTVWVRIIYMAELASQGNVGNYPMYFTGKIDSTQFVPLDGVKQAESCRAAYDVTDLTAEINDTQDGFRIKGFLKTTADVFETVSSEVVTDFYDMDGDVIFDSEIAEVCSGIDKVSVQQIVKDTADLRDEHWDTAKIVYTDTHVLEYNIEEREGKAQVSGKLQAEVLVMEDRGRSATVRKTCEFAVNLDLPEGYMADCCRIFVRDVSAELAGSLVNFTVQLQVEADLCRFGSISLISNPCIVNGENIRRYPLIVCTVKEGETLWDIAKRHRVRGENIRKISEGNELLPGMKVVVAK